MNEIAKVAKILLKENNQIVEIVNKKPKIDKRVQIAQTF